jgi:hypothetical protein
MWDHSFIQSQAYAPDPASPPILSPESCTGQDDDNITWNAFVHAMSIYAMWLCMWVHWFIQSQAAALDSAPPISSSECCTGQAFSSATEPVVLFLICDARFPCHEHMCNGGCTCGFTRSLSCRPLHLTQHQLQYQDLSAAPAKMMTT